MARRGATGVAGVVTGAAIVVAALVVAASGRSPDLMSRPRTTIGSPPPTTIETRTTSVAQETGAVETIRGWDLAGLFAVSVLLAALFEQCGAHVVQCANAPAALSTLLSSSV